MLATARILALTVAFAALAHGARADDKEEIKKLIPAATAMSKVDFQKLATAKTVPRAEDIAEKSLTLKFLALRPPETLTDEQKAQLEFAAVSVNPAKLAGEIAGGRFSLAPLTFIHTNRITDITCDVVGDKATGVVSYKVPNLYQGKANYAAQKKDGAWQITELSMPAYDIHVIRGEKGTWEDKK